MQRFAADFELNAPRGCWRASGNWRARFSGAGLTALHWAQRIRHIPCRKMREMLSDSARSNLRQDCISYEGRVSSVSVGLLNIANGFRHLGDYVAIYWNNHYHMLHTVSRVTGGILWANMHLLFWLSLIPFATRWMGENHLAHAPTALYGVALLMPATAYSILQRSLIAVHGSQGHWRKPSAAISRA